MYIYDVYIYIGRSYLFIAPRHFLFWRFNSGSKVAICRAPVAPRGCPRAMAPPLGFTCKVNHKEKIPQHAHVHRIPILLCCTENHAFSIGILRWSTDLSTTPDGWLSCHWIVFWCTNSTHSLHQRSAESMFCWIQLNSPGLHGMA